ncbi:type II secretion system protein [Rubripirellula amarantea]|nr:type II secretion system protein [Rubripirellula amarantea]
MPLAIRHNGANWTNCRALLQSHGPPSRAFSLIDSIIAALIVGIVAVIALPHYLDLGDHPEQARIKHQLSVLREAIDMAKDRDGQYPPAGQLVAVVGPMLNQPFPTPRLRTESEFDTIVHYDVSDSERSPVTPNPNLPGIWAYKPANGQLRLNVSNGSLGWDW